MANAFYSLYSHVSRTPLQKLATPEFTFSSPMERIERFRSSLRSEPRSPVERLKDTVSKMCLYTGSPRGSDSTSPQASPRKRASLPDVVGAVLKAKSGASKNLELGEYSRSNSDVDVRLLADGDTACNGVKKEQTQTVVVTDILQNGSCQMDMKSNKQMSNVDAYDINVTPGDSESRTHSIRTSLASSLSGETVIETQLQLESCFTQRDSRTAELKPAAKITYDLICPQIFESVLKAPFCCQHTHSLKTNTLPPMCSDTGGTETSPWSHTCNIQNPVSEPAEDSETAAVASSQEATQVDPFTLLYVPVVSGPHTHYCITVTGAREDQFPPCSLKTPDSRPSSMVPPVQTCEEPFNDGTGCYLKPLTNRSLLHFSTSLQQVNSFELEEVQ